MNKYSADLKLKLVQDYLDGKGGSSGANGHTGVFLSNNRIIHCSYGSNGIAETSTEGGWLVHLSITID